MRRLSCICLIASATTLVGCGTAQPIAAAPADAPVALGALGPAASDATYEPGGLFYFGAGDSIGQEVFTYYVACLRLNEHYATGGSDFPSD